MGTTAHRTIRTTVAIAAAVCILGVGGAAQARQDAGPRVPTELPTASGLARVGTQYVHGDNLTGNGVAAPRWIPEYR